MSTNDTVENNGHIKSLKLPMDNSVSTTLFNDFLNFGSVGLHIVSDEEIILWVATSIKFFYIL